MIGSIQSTLNESRKLKNNVTVEENRNDAFEKRQTRQHVAISNDKSKDFSSREMRGSQEGFRFSTGIRETVLMIRPKVRHLLDYFIGQRWQDCNQQTIPAGNVSTLCHVVKRSFFYAGRSRWWDREIHGAIIHA